MKCFEVTKCPEEAREACYVWNCFRDNPADMEQVKCWVLKGVYQEESGEQLKKCKQCAYYITMNRDSGIVSDADTDIAVITCEGTLNHERTKALEKVWDNLKQHNKFRIILDLSRINNIYSCGLGAIIKIHKDAAAAKGLLVVVCAEGYVTSLFAVTKLSRILKMVRNHRDAHDIFDALKKKESDAQKAAAEAAKPAQTQGAALLLGVLQEPQPQERDRLRRMLQEDQTDKPAVLDRRRHDRGHIVPVCQRRLRRLRLFPGVRRRLGIVSKAFLSTP